MKKKFSSWERPIHRISRIGEPYVHIVRSGETLESISQTLRIENPQYLLAYHNERCPSFDIIPEDGSLRLLQRLCIPTLDEVLTMNALIQEHGAGLHDLFPMKKIAFDIRTIQGDYQVRQTESDDGVQRSEYAYTLHFNHLKEEAGLHYIHFSMDEFKKEGQELDQKINHLAQAFVRIIYPITLIMNASGSFIKAELHKEIKEILREIEDLKKYHKGAYASLHIDQMKSKMADPQIMYDGLSKTLALQLLFTHFHQIHTSYRDEFSWLAPASPIKLELTNQILPQKDSQFLDIVQTGRSVDYRTLQELYHTDWNYDELAPSHSRSLMGSHSAVYTLNAEDYSVQKITAGFDVQMADYEKTMTFEMERRVG